MNLSQTLKFRELEAAAAGSQATVADSRASDDWIKNYLDKKDQRLNDTRIRLNGLMERMHHMMEPPETRGMKASWNVYKPSITWEQHPEKIASGGQWAVTDPEGLILSTWPTRKEAERAAFSLYKGLAPSSTGATAGARVKRLSAADIFQDTEHGDKTRAKFLKHPKPRVVKLADFLRTGDLRPSSHGGGAAGAGGAAGPGGGGSGSS
jgi:hypothetical protein